MSVEVKVPDIGDAKAVAVVEVLVKTGAKVAVDEALITLESEKASMDVPSPVAGVVKSIQVKRGDEVSAGAVIALVDVEESGDAKPAASPSADASDAVMSAIPSESSSRSHKARSCLSRGISSSFAPVRALRRALVSNMSASNPPTSPSLGSKW